MAFIRMMERSKSFEEGYSEFLGYCKARNLRPATVKHYDDIINYNWYKYFEPTNPINSISQTTIIGFIQYMKDRGVKDVTINTSIRGIRTILYYFMRLGYCDDFKIADIKFDKEPIETYTDEEIRLLLVKPDLKKCRFSEFRTWVACNFMLATGARLSTLIEMKIPDLDFENDLIKYRHTKNRRSQVVPMSMSLKRILMEYITYLPPDGYLFPNSWGEQLSRVTMTHSVQHYAQRRGVMKTGVHRWRHTFAKKWILEGGDPFRLQKMLGHSDMTIVKNYVEMFTEDLQRDFDTFNPLETIQPTVRKHLTVRR